MAQMADETHHIQYPGAGSSPYSQLIDAALSIILSLPPDDWLGPASASPSDSGRGLSSPLSTLQRVSPPDPSVVLAHLLSSYDTSSSDIDRESAWESILSHLSENPTSWFGNVLPLSPAVRRYASSGAASAPFLSQLSLLARARPPGPLHAAPDPDLVALYRSARVPAPLPEPVTWEMRMAQRMAGGGGSFVIDEIDRRNWEMARAEGA